jgi:hypothetical protein
VRPATTDPQAKGHASSTASALGALRKLPTSIFSIAGAIGSTGIPILTFSADSRRLGIRLGFANGEWDFSSGQIKLAAVKAAVFSLRESLSIYSLFSA